MRLTLLELTQIILSSLDSDEVNSINDTVESQQVAKVIRTVYYDLISKISLPELHDLRSLTASGDNTKPTLMTVPSDIRSIQWIKYNRIDPNTNEDTFTYVTILPTTEFMNIIHSFRTDESNVSSFTQTIDGDTIEFYYKNDKEPDFCTIFDDNTVIFDSYNSVEDTTLQSVKSLLYGEVAPDFDMSDNFTPALDEKQFALLLNDAKVLAFAELKQMPHQVAMANSRKQQISLQKTKSKKEPVWFNELPNFGRKIR